MGTLLIIIGFFVGFFVFLFGSLKLGLMIHAALKDRREKKGCPYAEIEALKNGYRAVYGYLTASRDRGKGSPVGRHVREMVELLAHDFDLQATNKSEAMREGLEEQIFLNHMSPGDKAKMVRVS